MVPVEEGVAVVHIRRAHLRILFERFMARLRAGRRLPWPPKRS